jgi:glycosyltransferase involved in cell wall biosynthesis
VTVYFYTGGYTHNLHREAFLAPPEGVRFIASSTAVAQPVGPIELGRKTANAIPRLGLTRVGLAAFQWLGVPKIKAIRAPSATLIHSAQDPLMTRRPWVVEVEDVSAFFWYRRRILEKHSARWVVETALASRSCRAILPWSEASKRSLLHGLDCSRFGHKIRVVYPCIAPRNRATPRHGRIKLLFVGSTFFTKGGIETLRAFYGLKEPRAELVIVAPVPPEIARGFADDPRITVCAGISDDELDYHYRTASGFVLPVHTDTFGFVFLEAMAHGIPCISTNLFAVPEIVRHEVTGLTVEAENPYFDARGLPRFDPPMQADHELVRLVQTPSAEYVERLRAAMARLVSDSTLRTRLSDAAYEEVRVGRFSRARRQAGLAEVYRDATKSP